MYAIKGNELLSSSVLSVKYAPRHYNIFNTRHESIRSIPACSYNYILSDNVFGHTFAFNRVSTPALGGAFSSGMYTLKDEARITTKYTLRIN